MKKLFLIVSLIIITPGLKAQDIHFSQLSETPLLLNPASTGVYDGYYRCILNYKSQWAAMGNPYRTFMGSFDMPIENNWNEYGAYIGIGAFVFSDKAGDSDFGTTQGNVSFSGIVPIDDGSTISAGIEAGVAQRSVDIAAIQWPNQYDGQSYNPNLPSYEANRAGSYLFFDMAAGVHYEFLKYFGTLSGKEMVRFTAGAALFHVTKPLQRFYEGSTEHQYPRIVVHSSLIYDFEGTTFGIVPSVLYMLQGPASEIDAGILLRFKISQGTKVTGFISESAFSAGLHYRYKDAFSPQVFFELSNFGIGLSYDINISSFSQATKNKGGLEISIKYSKMRGALYRNKR
ncbi:MAG: PorP/SprF family type IX secretion system membrane protein [Bacteroidota bacterium]